MCLLVRPPVFFGVWVGEINRNVQHRAAGAVSKAQHSQLRQRDDVADGCGKIAALLSKRRIVDLQWSQLPCPNESNRPIGGPVPMPSFFCFILWFAKMPLPPVCSFGSHCCHFFFYLYLFISFLAVVFVIRLCLGFCGGVVTRSWR